MNFHRLEEEPSLGPSELPRHEPDLLSGGDASIAADGGKVAVAYGTNFRCLLLMRKHVGNRRRGLVSSGARAVGSPRTGGVYHRQAHGDRTISFEKFGLQL